MYLPLRESVTVLWRKLRAQQKSSSQRCIYYITKIYACQEFFEYFSFLGILQGIGALAGGCMVKCDKFFGFFLTYISCWQPFRASARAGRRENHLKRRSFSLLPCTPLPTPWLSAPLIRRLVCSLAAGTAPRFRAGGRRNPSTGFAGPPFSLRSAHLDPSTGYAGPPPLSGEVLERGDLRSWPPLKGEGDQNPRFWWRGFA